MARASAAALARTLPAQLYTSLGWDELQAQAHFALVQAVRLWDPSRSSANQWIWTKVRYGILDQIRDFYGTRRWEMPACVPYEEYLHARPDAAPPQDRLILYREIAEHVARLPVRQWQVVWLRYYGELTQAETAAALGLSASRVSQLERRGLARLREEMGA